MSPGFVVFLLAVCAFNLVAGPVERRLENVIFASALVISLAILKARD